MPVTQLVSTFNTAFKKYVDTNRGWILSAPFLISSLDSQL